MFDLLKLIAKKEELQIALEGVAIQTSPNYRDNYCVDCSGVCRDSCRAECNGAVAGHGNCRILTN